jgi:hypothetical protein
MIVCEGGLNTATLRVFRARFMKQDKPKMKRTQARRWPYSAGLVLLLAMAVAVANPGWVRARLAAAKLLPQPEAFTELYFTQHLLLPKTAASPLSFSFTVHNAEGTATTYPYAIVMTQPDGKVQTLQTGSLALQNGETRNVTTKLVLPANTTAAEIAVVLPVQQESIDFWLGAAS